MGSVTAESAPAPAPAPARRSQSSSSSTAPSAPPEEGAFAAKVFDKACVPAHFFALPPAPTAALAREPAVRAERLPGLDAWVFDGVFSEKECEALREQTEAVGYTYWDPEGAKCNDFRTAYTIETHHGALAATLWERIGPFFESVDITEDSPRHEVDIEGRWTAAAVNPKLLFARYLDGGHFSPHTDGTTVFDFNSRTFYTVIVYLNESPSGGETRIFDDQQIAESLELVDGKRRGREEWVKAAVVPRAGRAVAFYHRLMHEGCPAAEKYIIRTDIVYERRPAQCTLPEDQEAFRFYMEAQEKAEKGLCQEAMVLFRRAFKMSAGLRRVYGQ